MLINALGFSAGDNCGSPTFHLMNELASSSRRYRMSVIAEVCFKQTYLGPQAV